jgi:NAD(P)-dependent dehydrogenase (short-subunit alcohol dehydrogenase family)
MRLKEKAAVITGGSSGIGLATARLFVKEGAKVAITGRNQERLDAAAQELGPSTLTFKADVLDLEARESLFASIKERFGRLDIVFANAGGGMSGSIAETTQQIFDDVLRTNVTGVFLTVQAALPLLGRGASVILNGSVAGTVGFPPGGGSYAASKAALGGLSRSLAGELSPLGIRVNVVAPGFTLTPPWTKQDSPESRARKKKLQSGIALDRWGAAEEIAKAVLFLASDDSTYVNCTDIVVDGGLSGALFAAPYWRS